MKRTKTKRRFRDVSRESVKAINEHRAGDRDALNRLTELHRGYVVQQAHRVAFADGYERDSHTIDDLIQEGMIGLVHCVPFFNIERGIPFLAFARFHIRARMIRLMQNNGLVHTPTTAHPSSGGTAYFPDAAMRARRLRAVGFGGKRVSFDAALLYIPTPDQAHDLEEDNGKLREALDRLHPHHAQMLIDRYGLFGHEQVLTLAKTHKVSKQRISQIEDKARQHLRLALINPTYNPRQNQARPESRNAYPQDTHQVA
jgi:RNA polymerase sigma factor (sigma-70 family)